MSAFRQARIRQYLKLRAEILQTIRIYFCEHDYLEVETPIRISEPIPEAHIDPIESEKFVLQTSPEVCMKQLLAAGYPKIFQLCKCFRKHERGHLHLSEFTMLEWYRADSDYQGMMRETEDMIYFVARSNDIGEESVYGDHIINLRPPWDRITVSDAFARYASVSIHDALDHEKFDEIIGCDIAPKLGNTKPVFLYDYPARCGALAKLKDSDPSVAERFELYICGIELCNGFSELTDSVIQRQRFETEMEIRKLSGKSTYPMPEKFLSALSEMPNASGNALGIDRLLMLFANVCNIDDVVSFTPEEL
jgi:lysyl-tRNA synthetase class 2